MAVSSIFGQSRKKQNSRAETMAEWPNTNGNPVRTGPGPDDVRLNEEYWTNPSPSPIPKSESESESEADTEKMRRKGVCGAQYQSTAILTVLILPKPTWARHCWSVK